MVDDNNWIVAFDAKRIELFLDEKPLDNLYLVMVL